VLYFDGPDKYHSSYSIRVKHKDLKDLKNELDSTKTSRAFDYDKNETEIATQFAALVRINETVSKVYF